MANRINSPAPYTAEVAVAYESQGGTAQRVSSVSPLPVMLASVASQAPLEGSANADDLVGPFRAAPNKVVTLVLHGEWEGSVTVKRSTDNSVTLHTLTVNGRPYSKYSTNVCEPVWEETAPDAELYLDISLISGEVFFRMGQ